MKRQSKCKAFILVEILTGMLLQAGFIIVLCTSFYLMLSFYTRTQQTLSARQKGERVIAYVDARIRNADLGLGKCSNSEEIREALSKVTDLLEKNQKLTLPVSVTSGNWKLREKDSDNKFRGNRLTLLYAQRASAATLIIRTIESPDKSGFNYSVDINAITNELCLVAKKNDKGKETFGDSEFLEKSKETSLKSYTVMAETGVPLYLNKSDNEGGFTLINKISRPAYVYPGDELLYLKSERMFVEGQNFKFQKFNGASWGDITSSELGILEMYFELDTSNNILDMYVLSSGGMNDSGKTQKPLAWPSSFWKSEYENYVVYISRASWKLKNLSGSFNWN